MTAPDAEDIVARLAALDPEHAVQTGYDVSESRCFFCARDVAEDGHAEDCLYVAAALHTPARDVIAARVAEVDYAQEQIRRLWSELDGMYERADAERERLHALTSGDWTPPRPAPAQVQALSFPGVLVLPDDIVQTYGPDPDDVASQFGSFMRGDLGPAPTVFRQSEWDAMTDAERARHVSPTVTDSLLSSRGRQTPTRRT